MKTNKQGPFQESFYHQPAPVRMARRSGANRGGSARGGKKAK